MRVSLFSRLNDHPGKVLVDEPADPHDEVEPAHKGSYADARSGDDDRGEGRWFASVIPIVEVVLLEVFAGTPPWAVLDEPTWTRRHHASAPLIVAADPLR